MAAPIKHSRAFRIRRFLNWFPMGLTYAFLYMGRYNLTVAKNALGEVMTKEDFGWIFGAGTVTYAFAFLVNGPLTDRVGGRRGILAAALGSAICNLLMGLFIHVGLVKYSIDTRFLLPTFTFLYAANMYFQSFGAVSIVKVNAHWFHVRERGGFSGIFGAMIASGIFFAFTGNSWILEAVSDPAAPSLLPYSMWVFYAPAALLITMFVIEFIILRDTPGKAGFEDFDTGDASSGRMDEKLSTLEIFKRIFTNPIIVTIAFIEFCSGVLRNGVMHWFPFYAKEILSLEPNHYLVNGSWGHPSTVVPFFVLSAVFFFLLSRAKRPKWRAIFAISGVLMFITPFLQAGWGGILMVAGVLGSNVAGWVSDIFFQSRRAPAAGLLYLGLIIATISMIFALVDTTNEVRWVAPDPIAEKLGLDQLQPGDKIIEIAGVKNIKNWSDVSKAVACIPAKCINSVWDLEQCKCTNSPKKPAPPDIKTSNGKIEAVVIRNGQRIHLTLRDPAPQLRAGDQRKLKAGPVLLKSEYWLGVLIFLISMCVIGSHGLMSGTATMDFGGRKAAATAVGLIDGFVYLGTAVQSVALGYLTTLNWHYWPLFLIPFAIIGFILCLRIWKALPEATRKSLQKEQESKS